MFRKLNTQANKSSIIAIASMLLKYLPTLYKDEQYSTQLLYIDRRNKQKTQNEI